jgi:hypothetical protein
MIRKKDLKEEIDNLNEFTGRKKNYSFSLQNQIGEQGKRIDCLFDVIDLLFKKLGFELVKTPEKKEIVKIKKGKK